ncbi:hypothetical protein JW796_02145 [Candidatus Dojkabacteria bacterium]|nr:hypothetical protein [Candidatus Dojkabacteria bacterium]
MKDLCDDNLIEGIRGSLSHKMLDTSLFVESSSPEIDNGIIEGIIWTLKVLDTLCSPGMKMQLVNNLGCRGIQDFPLVRAGTYEDRLGNTHYFIQIPNQSSHLRGLKLVGNQTEESSTYYLPGIYGNYKHTAKDPEVIPILIGVEEATHIVCKECGIDFVYDNKHCSNKQHMKFEKPDSQSEEDYCPSELVALFMQYIYLEENCPLEFSGLNNLNIRVTKVIDLLYFNPYPEEVSNKVYWILDQIRRIFPESEVFNCGRYPAIQQKPAA